jgi:hypothetical protein
MNIRTVEVRVARKLSRNYNSTEFVVGLVADLEPGEEAEVVGAGTHPALPHHDPRRVQLPEAPGSHPAALPRRFQPTGTANIPLGT